MTTANPEKQNARISHKLIQASYASKVILNPYLRRLSLLIRLR